MPPGFYRSIEIIDIKALGEIWSAIWLLENSFESENTSLLLHNDTLYTKIPTFLIEQVTGSIHIHTCSGSWVKKRKCSTLAF